MRARRCSIFTCTSSAAAASPGRPATRTEGDAVQPQVLHDFRFACRNAARRPGFTLLVALTLALGLGVNSSVFALVDAVLLRPLPYPQASRLAFVWQTLPEHNVFELEPTPYDYTAWHGVGSFSALGLVLRDAFTLDGDEDRKSVV